MHSYNSIRKNKYHSVSTEHNGRMYHSKFEASIAADLDLLKHASDPHERVQTVEPQYPIDIYLLKNVLTLSVTPHKVFRYYADFRVIYADGREEIIEAKGLVMAEFRLKWPIVQAVYEQERPGVTFKMISNAPQRKQKWKPKTVDYDK